MTEVTRNVTKVTKNVTKITKHVFGTNSEGPKRSFVDVILVVVGGESL